MDRVDLAREMLRLSRESGDAASQRVALLTLGRAYAEVDMLEEAICSFEDWLHLSGDHDPAAASMILTEIAFTLLKQHQPESALEQGRRALALATAGAYAIRRWFVAAPLHPELGSTRTPPARQRMTGTRWQQRTVQWAARRTPCTSLTRR
jgi:hypothetical protein